MIMNERKKVAIIDYGMGNLFSLAKALEYCGSLPEVVSDPVRLKYYTRAILPGVGAFSDGMANLCSVGWCSAIQDFSQKSDLLGVCLGMQLLADRGNEFSDTEGLGIISGEVLKIFPINTEKIPHIGWNEVKYIEQDLLFENISINEDFYFVHSYHFQVNDRSNIIATTDYAGGFVSIVKQSNVYGVQFHPEKSGNAGLQLLKNFLRITR